MLDKLQEALMAGKKADVEALVDQALAAGLPTRRILNEGLISGMEKLGVLFKNNEVFIPEVLVAARAMNAGLTKLEPYLIKDKIEPKGTVVIGTVKGRPPRHRQEPRGHDAQGGRVQDRRPRGRRFGRKVSSRRPGPPGPTSSPCPPS